MNPVELVLIVGISVCAIVWVLSLITYTHSWVDRLWSIVPVVYIWIFAGAAHLADPRLDLMAVLVTLWGARLTFNFARKGGYSGHEDYRWPVLRARMKRWQFELFNLGFIVGFQNAVLVLITFPALTAYEHRGTPFGALDVIVGLVFLACTVGETIADQQQWDFHAEKKAKTDAGGRADPRFLQAGLFRFSRHPNFFFELAQWWVLFLFGAVAAGSLVQWTVLGPVLLLAVFIGSTRFTESITLSKYPEYAEYQGRTSAIVPWLPRRESASNATAH